MSFSVCLGQAFKVADDAAAESSASVEIFESCFCKNFCKAALDLILIVKLFVSSLKLRYFQTDCFCLNRVKVLIDS